MSELYFKNGKAKKKYCLCLTKEYQSEIKRINGYININWICGGLRCPLYKTGCGSKGTKIVAV